ncbi:uncharacterized protein LOC132285658 [Cornus florida]|uniref:uncharacterized protein LOC132285658 n=1 Tax=Cornus florida TaxID=4283 RepID=UPI0028A082E7|nr:uncharacterized protein LOC132285658 [Cornus florida]
MSYEHRWRIDQSNPYSISTSQDQIFQGFIYGRTHIRVACLHRACHAGNYILRTKTPQVYRRIVASTDGLLLLEAYISGQTKLCVHNPITGLQKLLPTTLNHREILWGNFVMVHDSSNEIYKVVLFIGDPCIIHEKIHIITVDNDGDRAASNGWN